MFLNKYFAFITCAYLKKRKVFNVESSTYYFYRTTKTLVHFQICISEPLSKYFTCSLIATFCLAYVEYFEHSLTCVN